MGKSGLRSSILSILGALPQIWAKVVSEAPFQVFWEPGSGMGQKWAQELHFKHFEGTGRGYVQKWPRKLNFKPFGSLAVDIDKSGIRSSVLSILGTWPWIWAKVASGDPF